MDQQAIRDAVRTILAALGDDPTREEAMRLIRGQ